jgi:hypothetical protein
MCRAASGSHHDHMLNITPELVKQLHADRTARLQPARTERRRAHVHLPGLAVWQVVKPRRALRAPCTELQPCP